MSHLQLGARLDGDATAFLHLTRKMLLRAELATDPLDAAEVAGIQGACTFLTMRGLDWLPAVVK